MKSRSTLPVAVAMLVSVIAYLISVSGQADESSAAVYLTKAPSGYRDWTLISVAHEEGDLHSFAAVLGNDVAVKAYRAGTLPFPDGAVILALRYSHTPSEENDKVFGRKQSFVPGAPSNIQWEVKDSTKYAATGGWGFGQVNANGKPVEEASFKNLRSLPRAGFS